MSSKNCSPSCSECGPSEPIGRKPDIVPPMFFAQFGPLGPAGERGPPGPISYATPRYEDRRKLITPKRRGRLTLIRDPWLGFDVPAYSYRHPPQHKVEKTVYDDTQNVHNTTVNESTKVSVLNLRTDPKPDVNLALQAIQDSDIDTEAKAMLAKFGSDTQVNSILGLSLAEMIAYVWQRIETYPDIDVRPNLRRILGEQALGCLERDNLVCNTGKMTRILSTLDGFCPDISIKISDNDQIAAIVLQAKSSLEPYDAAAHRSTVEARLKELGYSAEIMQPWLDAITE